MSRSALGRAPGSEPILLLQTSTDDGVRVGFDEHEFFARVHDCDAEVYGRLSLWRKGRRAAAGGVDLITPSDREGSNRAVQTGGYRAG